MTDERKGRTVSQETECPAPLLCSTGCGYYGNPRNNGMCSVCYRDLLQRHAPPAGPSNETRPSSHTQEREDRSEPASSSAAGGAQVPDGTQSSPPEHRGSAEATEAGRSRRGKKRKQKAEPRDAAIAETAVTAQEPEEAGADVEEKPKPKRTRCYTCRKRVGLTGFDCRCGNIFCSTHRYSDAHDCTFDYRAAGAERIRRENPVVAGEKIHKI